KRLLLAASKSLAASAVVITLGQLTFGSGTGLSAQTTTSAAPIEQAAPKTIWDGVYTKEQAARGQQAYKQTCGYCHGPDMSGSEVGGELAPELVGVFFV